MDIQPINSSELRIGNLVNILLTPTNRNITTLTVSLVDDEGVVFAKTLNGRVTRMEKGECAGIPLNQEWYIKLGFSIETSHDSSGREYFYYRHENRDFPDVRGDNRINDIDIHFVHQLQNWFFCYTGEELTIKQLV
jgi:hypothetical protein